MLITLDSISWDYMKFKGSLDLRFYNDTLFFRRQLALEPQVTSVFPLQSISLQMGAQTFLNWISKHSNWIRNTIKTAMEMEEVETFV